MTVDAGLDAPGITIGQMVDAGPAALPEAAGRPRPMTAVERAAARAATVADDAAGTDPAPDPEPEQGGTTGSDHAPDPARTIAAASGAPMGDGGRAPSPSPARCDGFHPTLGRCEREPGHRGNHRNREGETWA